MLITTKIAPFGLYFVPVKISYISKVIRKVKNNQLHAIAFSIGSQGLRAILRGKGNPIEAMNECDVKPFLQAALTTPGGWKVVDLDDPEVPHAGIVEGEQATTSHQQLYCCQLLHSTTLYT